MAEPCFGYRPGITEPPSSRHSRRLGSFGRHRQARITEPLQAATVTALVVSATDQDHRTSRSSRQSYRLSSFGH
jgi:hypothetical protein